MYLVSSSLRFLKRVIIFIRKHRHAFYPLKILLNCSLISISVRNSWVSLTASAVGCWPESAIFKFQWRTITIITSLKYVVIGRKKKHVCFRRTFESTFLLEEQILNWIWRNLLKGSEHIVIINVMWADISGLTSNWISDHLFYIQFQASSYHINFKDENELNRTRDCSWYFFWITRMKQR